MTLLMAITAATTDAQIDDVIMYSDMRDHAREMRDMALTVADDHDEQDEDGLPLLEYHEIDGIHVLHSPIWAYAYVNERSAGVGDSRIIDNDDAPTPGIAAAIWLAD
jgi:hypothetical protein